MSPAALPTAPALLRRMLRLRVASFLAALLVGVSLGAVAQVAPGIVAPGSTPHAQAAVYNCGCPASAYRMLDRWDNLNFPRGAAWRQIGSNQWLYGGAVHQNREQQLPLGRSYREYDAHVYSYRGQSRGARRIVVDMGSYAAWYTPNHYRDFYRM